MPHADSAYVPDDITTKEQFYAHVTEQLSALLDGSRYWVSNLAQASSLLSNSYLSSPLYGFAKGSNHAPRVNWVGFYIHPPSSSPSTASSPLLLGPYIGRPACITITPISGKGVCADTFVHDKAVVVDDVEAYPGHIACDGQTRSEVVIPLRMHTRIPYPFGDGGDPNNGGNKVALRTVGVLDLDSVDLSTFDQADAEGLGRVVEILAGACDWE